ncbi:MAG: UPF0280 family protein [Actinomycetia bacterium]|nr:UPF0280 family protein [Actinomycetes bacterium]
MSAESDIKINRLTTDRDLYRQRVSSRTAYHWQISYRFTNLYIASDRDIADAVVKYLPRFYRILETVATENPSFLKALSPISISGNYPPIISRMIARSKQFKVGPMAAVAGAACDYLAEKAGSRCSTLIIENGGDTYIKSKQDIVAQVFTSSSRLSDKIKLNIPHHITPCGLCCSSGQFGHSLSLGKSEIACVLASTATAADAAATALANHILEDSHIGPALDRFKGEKGLWGLLAVKDKKIGLWGKLELCA